MGEPQPGQSLFRSVVGHFATGVVVVTGIGGGVPSGFTCQSFSALSLDPPLVFVGPGRSSLSWPRIASSGAFGVSILADDQEALARVFAMSGRDMPGAEKFRGVHWWPGATGAPRLAGAAAWVDCTIEAVHPAGDHYAVVGAVVDLAAGEGRPLLFHRGGFARLGADRAGS
ncbi:MAG: flavin reductase family protein [Acidimicrobiales bacterium]